MKDIIQKVKHLFIVLLNFLKKLITKFEGKHFFTGVKNIFSKSYFNKFDDLKIKYKKDPKKALVLIFSIVIAFSILVGSSYAYLTYISKTNNKVTISAGTLALSFENEANAISLSNELPQEDKEALGKNEEYDFTITNKGTLDSNFKITLDNTCTVGKSYTIEGESVTVDKCIPNKYIKVGLKEETDGVYEILKYNEEDGSYIIDSNYLNAGESRNYKMKIWLSYDTPNDYNSAGGKNIVYSAKLGLSYEQGEEKTEKNTYIVRYNANGGEGSISDSTFTYGTAKALSKNTFTKEGYNFIGWSTLKDGKVEYTDQEEVKDLTTTEEKVITLYAVWGKGINYTVVYDTNGGEDKKSEVFEYDKIEKIDKPTKEFKVNITNSASGTLSVESVSKAQTFAGWTADSNLNTTTAEYGSSALLGTKWTDPKTKAVATYFRNLRKTSGTVTLTANWKPVAVTLPTITKTGYECGYSESSTGTEITYKSGSSYLPSETESSKTLYTVCEATTYTVEYYTYDGKTKLGTSTHDYGVSKALTTMSTLGGSAPSSKVSFYGWATEENSTKIAYADGERVKDLADKGGEAVKLYAIWRSEGVTLTYKSGINSATSSTSSTYYYYNGATSVSITTGAPASITNWSALGWRDDKAADAKEYSSNTATNFSQSTTLYGVYSRSYTANFYSGASKATTTTVTSSTAYYNSSEASTPTTVSITTASAANSTDISNWTELGWRDDTTADAKEYSYGSSVTVAFGTDFYGVYSRTLTISYNGNSSTGGSTSNTTKTVYLNSNSATTSSQTVTLASNGFTRTGYTFSKWAAGSASGTEYSAGASYTAGVAYNASTFGTTMYAKWSANTYAIEYYTYDGASKLGTSNHTYAAAKALTTMSSLGGSAPSSKVSFYGWATSANSTTRAYSDGESVTSLTSTSGGTVKLYAIWRSSGVTLTYKSGINSATSSTSSTYYYYNGATSVAITTGAPASVTNWSALGWRDDTTAGVKEYSSNTATNFSQSTTLYGVYSRSYTANFYSGASKATTTKVTSSTAYYNSSQSATPTTVSITTVSATNSTDISNWTELGWRDDTTADAKEYSYGASVTVAFGTNFYGVYSRTLTVSYNGNSSTGGSTSNTTKTVYLNSNSTTTSSQAVTLASNGFTRTGYTFSKWAAGSASGTEYSAGASYTPGVAYNASTFGTTMYAKWTANTYTVEYYTYDGATKLGNSTHTYAAAKALTTMSSLGGTAPSSKVSFYGWATSANSTTRAYSDGESVTSLTSTSGGTVKVYAIWRSSGVTLTYKSGINSATSSTSETYYYFNAATSVAIKTATPASITNWTALGWRDDTTAGAKEYSSNTSSNFSQSTTLYGVYSRSYTANFYSGASKATTTTVTSSTAYYNSSQSATPTTVSITTASAANSTDISNWTELGWRDDTTADAKEYSYGSSVTVAFGTDFYGVYSRTLTISYNGNSSTGGSTSNTTKTVYLNSNSATTSSQTVTLASNGFTRTGYTFSKWAAGSASGTEYSAGASYTAGVAYNASTFGTTMYAKWSANTYAIEYYTYDGASKLGTSNHTYAAAKALTTMSSLGGSAPSSKVSFYGWATSANSTTRAYSDGESVTSLTSTSGGTVKLYAIWRSSGVTLTYKSGVNNEEISTSDTYYYYNAATSVSIKTAYTSDILYWNNLGWRDDTIAGDKEYSMNTSYSFSSSTILYGAYSRIITVYYSGNNNTGGSTSNTIKTIYLNSNSTTTSDQTITLASNGFTKTGYIFSKWEERYTYEQYGAGTSYNPNFSYNDQEDGDLKVYMSAVWTAKTKSISFQITYDTSTFSGPSSAYSTSTYQTLSKSSTTLRYGTNERITASPAYPDDRYTGSVSCTNGITATLTVGSGTTDRTDTIKVTNNSDSTTSSVCTIKYTPKWEGIAYGSYTAGNNLTYAGSTWTIKADNGANTGLVLNATAGTGDYKSDVQSNLGNSSVNTDVSGGGIVAQSSGAYVSTDGGISTGYTNNVYWTGSSKIYNSEIRNTYTVSPEIWTRGGNHYRTNLEKSTGDLTTVSLNSILDVTKVVDVGIISSSGSGYAVTDGNFIIDNGSYTSSVNSNYYSKHGRHNAITGGSTNRVNTDYKLLRLDDPSSSTWTITSSGSLANTYWYTMYYCGGSYHGKQVVYYYNDSNSFYYGNQGTGNGWNSDTSASFSTTYANDWSYSNSDGYRYADMAGYASSNCAKDNYVNCTYKTISGYTRYHRTYHFDTHNSNQYCYKPTTYTTKNVSVSVYYRPYLIVRER